MKICILIIYSYKSYYEKMRCILQSFYSEFDIPFYFIQFREVQDKDIVLEDNNIFVKGAESFAGITQKTMKAFELISNMYDFDFYIRSNISTVINIINLKQFLNSIPRNNIYCGGIKFTLNWIDNTTGGNYGKELLGLPFIQGTSIIISNDIVSSLCKNIDKINYELVDDLAFAVYIRDYHNDILTDTNNYLKYRARTECITVSNLEKILSEKNVVFYRNNLASCERQIEIGHMTRICQELSKI